MRRTIWTFCLACLTAFSGCSSLMFALFGSAYSGGGSPSEAREADYDQRVYAAENPSAVVPGASASPF